MRVLNGSVSNDGVERGEDTAAPEARTRCQLLTARGFLLGCAIGGVLWLAILAAIFL